jgi:hypothetical protein
MEIDITHKNQPSVFRAFKSGPTFLSGRTLRIFDDVQETELMANVVIYNNHYRSIEHGVSSLRAIALNLDNIAVSIIEKEWTH